MNTRFGVCVFSILLCFRYGMSANRVLEVTKTPVVQQVTAPFDHAEGPHWDEIHQVLYFVDISGHRVHRYDPSTGQVTFANTGDTVGVVIPIRGNGHRFVIGRGLKLSVLTWNGKNSPSPIIQDLTEVDQDNPTNRFNDGKADPMGRLWIGTMGFENPNGAVEMNRGTLYRASKHSCNLEPVVRNVSISNGIAWSRDTKLMYYIDSPTRRVDVFDYNILSATISNRRTFFDFEQNNVKGFPDGMTTDTDGNLWIACWGGSQVIQVDAYTGKLLSSIALPVERVTSVVYGGSNYGTLYVTTMRAGLTEAQLKHQPAAGAVFAITNLPVKGCRSTPVDNTPVDNCMHITNS